MLTLRLTLNFRHCARPTLPGPDAYMEGVPEPARAIYRACRYDPTYKPDRSHEGPGILCACDEGTLVLQRRGRWWWAESDEPVATVPVIKMKSFFLSFHVPNHVQTFMYHIAA